MPARSIKVWNSTTSEWEDVAVASPDTSSFVQNSLFANKGTIAAASAASTPAALSVGSNGETLIADSTATTGLRYQASYNAGRNRIINGGFDVWQRGTSTTGTDAFLADRWRTDIGGTPTTWTRERVAFTAGAAPEAGYEGTFFFRTTITTVGPNTVMDHRQRIEDVRTLAGRKATLSFWAKADSARTVTARVNQSFGSGGSADVNATTSNASVTTAWQRFSFTFDMPSISGKTIGTGHFVDVFFRQPSASGSVLDLWGVQLEAGSVATRFEEEPFEATLRKCQRYYQKSYNVDVNPGTSTDVGAVGIYTQATQSFHSLPSVSLGVRMRATPTTTIYSTTGASGKIRNVSDSADVNALTFYPGMSGFMPYVNNSSIAGAKTIAAQWVAEIEL